MKIKLNIKSILFLAGALWTSFSFSPLDSSYILQETLTHLLEVAKTTTNPESLSKFVEAIQKAILPESSEPSQWLEDELPSVRSLRAVLHGAPSLSRQSSWASQDESSLNGLESIRTLRNHIDLGSARLALTNLQKQLPQFFASLGEPEQVQKKLEYLALSADFSLQILRPVINEGNQATLGKVHQELQKFVDPDSFLFFNINTMNRLFQICSECVQDRFQLNLEQLEWIPKIAAEIAKIKGAPCSTRQNRNLRAYIKGLLSEGVLALQNPELNSADYKASFAIICQAFIDICSDQPSLSRHIQPFEQLLTEIDPTLLGTYASKVRNKSGKQSPEYPQTDTSFLSSIEEVTGYHFQPIGFLYYAPQYVQASAPTSSAPIYDPSTPDQAEFPYTVHSRLRSIERGQRTDQPCQSSPVPESGAFYSEGYNKDMSYALKSLWLRLMCAQFEIVEDQDAILKIEKAYLAITGIKPELDPNGEITAKIRIKDMLAHIYKVISKSEFDHSMNTQEWFKAICEASITLASSTLNQSISNTSEPSQDRKGYFNRKGYASVPKEDLLPNTLKGLSDLKEVISQPTLYMQLSVSPEYAHIRNALNSILDAWWSYGDEQERASKNNVKTTLTSLISVRNFGQLAMDKQQINLRNVHQRLEERILQSISNLSEHILTDIDNAEVQSALINLNQLKIRLDAVNLDALGCLVLD